MNNQQIPANKGDLGQALSKNLQYITDNFDRVLTSSNQIILDNLIQETKNLVNQITDNSQTYQEIADILGRIHQLWFQIWKQYRDEDSALDLIQYIDQFTNQITAYNQLFRGLSLINEGKTGEEKADLMRVVEGSLILSETIDIFIDIFADSELKQIYEFAQNALSVSNRDLTEYFQDTETSHLVTQLRAYSSLIILRIQERFKSNPSLEINPNTLADNLSDLDSSTQNLTGLVDLETENSSSENWLDNLSGSISDEQAFQKALEYGRVFRRTGKIDQEILTES
jgi:hypothetical protein